eukprot:TRINITY_DN6657_c0_g1_i3.p1 TRINITY_DN6657_c0_g1~~TRINITY_DN6657_c0_g1_i3.p1  ORF type:complete len:271 (+),score=63.48 TRINITY_DN6657_c0_g1_i3:43-855(+)
MAIAVMALMRTFEAASKALSAAEGLKLNNEQQLELYALYKQVTIGPCNVSKPAFYDFRGRTKWQAWFDLQSMPSTTAAERYIALVTTYLPAWHMAVAKDASSSSDYETDTDDAERSSDLTDDERSADEDRIEKGDKSKISLGPVVSRPVQPDQLNADDKTIFDFAQEGDVTALIPLLQGVDINTPNDEGETLLHVACDRGRLSLVEELLQRGADVTVKDAAGCTPLHFAAYCEHAAVAKALVAAGADIDAANDDKETPRQIAAQLFDDIA